MKVETLSYGIAWVLGVASLSCLWHKAVYFLVVCGLHLIHLAHCVGFEVASKNSHNGSFNCHGIHNTLGWLFEQRLAFFSNLCFVGQNHVCCWLQVMPEPNTKVIRPRLPFQKI